MAAEAKGFNNTTFELLKCLQSRAKTDQDKAKFDLLRNRIRTLLDICDDSVLVKNAAPVFEEFSDRITSEDEKFFTDMDVRMEYKRRTGKQIASDDEFIFDLVDTIKRYYQSFSANEKKVIRDKVLALHDAAIKYILLQLDQLSAGTHARTG
jgi:hypothetical protein